MTNRDGKVGNDPFRLAYGHADFAARFDAAVAAADNEAAVRLAHSLKGVAGNIGAIEVQRAAEALEVACRAGMTGADLAGARGEVEKTLDEVLAGLRKLEAPAQAAA